MAAFQADSQILGCKDTSLFSTCLYHLLLRWDTKSRQWAYYAPEPCRFRSPASLQGRKRIRNPI